jgi:hypothetical protein
LLIPITLMPAKKRNGATPSLPFWRLVAPLPIAASCFDVGTRDQMRRLAWQLLQIAPGYCLA